METRKERVVLETEGHQIIGDLHLPREGYLSRFSDFLNRNELRFITLTNAVVIERNETGVVGATERQFIAVGSDHVRIAYPEVEGE